MQNFHNITHPQLKFILWGLSIIFLLKIFLALKLDLYSDEVFYWQASSYPALAYSDLPFVTALLAGAGSLFDSGNPFAVRVLFIFLGSSVPFLFYWLALPIVGKRSAIESAALTACLPLLGSLGLLAVPDVPLIFLGILSIGFFERALRTNQTKFWLATGLFVALGFCTHYRFILYPASAIIFLLFFSPVRNQWKNPKLWLSFTLASLGLIPILWFNITYELDSVAFYFVERHPWQFEPSGLFHIFKQAGIVSPPLYLLFLLTIYLLYKKANKNEIPAALLLSFSLTNLLVYFVLAPWSDTTSTSMHWPLSGYIPLVVFLPESLRWVHSKIEKSWGIKSANFIATAIPAAGLIGTFAALMGVGSQAFQTRLQDLIGNEVLSNKMAGWSEFAEKTSDVLGDEFSSAAPVIITDNYYTAAQLEFAGGSTKVYTIDQDKAVNDGRFRQYQIWERHQANLNQRIGETALFITENSTLTQIDKYNVLGVMCRHSNNLSFVQEFSLFNGDKSFSYYIVDELIDSAHPSAKRAFPCPYPAAAWIDAPTPNQQINNIFTISGWAYNEDVGIDEVQVLMNDKVITNVAYGVFRGDVVEAMQVKTDPNAPELGFRVDLDTQAFENGSYELELNLVNKLGESTRHGKRKISINNL